jgi:PAS domain S-box-containing protein
MPKKSNLTTLAGPWLFRRRPWPLWTYLVLFAASVALPLLFIAIYFLEQAVALEQGRMERQLLQTAQTLVSDIDRDLERTIAVLETLATSEALERGDYAAFHAQARRAVQPTSGAVLLVDPTMQQLLNTWVEFGAALPKTSDPGTAERVLRTGSPDVSDLFHGVVSKRPAINVDVPVKIGGQTRYVLIMTFDASHFAAILQAQTLEPGWITGITDKKGIVLARSQRHHDFVGKPLPPELLRKSRSERGAFWGISIAGDHIVRTTAISERAGWLVSATSPTSAANATRNRVRLVSLALVSTALLIGGTFAAIFARFIAAPLERATEAAGRLGRGQLVEPISSSLEEADALTGALSRASYERKANDAANALLAAIVSSTGDAILSMEVDGTIRTWNPAAERIFGFTAHEAIGQSAAIVVPADRADERAGIYAKIKAGQTVSMETVRKTKAGQNFHASINVAPLRSGDGTVIGICSVVHDISELKRREEQAQFLARELAHRTKNLLAVIIGMAHETARHSRDLTQFRLRFGNRLQGLARSQDLLLQKDWEGVYLNELVTAQLSPFAELGSERIAQSGPQIFLKPEAVHSIGLAIHELATNASKYGALSVPGGRVELHWTVDLADDSDETLRILWRELGGPVVEAPVAKGFGRVVIEDMMNRALRAEVTLEYPPQGMVWRARIPAASCMAVEPTHRTKTGVTDV